MILGGLEFTSALQKFSGHKVDRENYTNINEFFIAWPGFKFFSKATKYPYLEEVNQAI